MTRLLVYKCDHCNYFNENRAGYINHLKEHIFFNRFSIIESYSKDNISSIINTIANKARENPSSVLGDSATNLLAFLNVEKYQLIKNNTIHIREAMDSYIDAVYIKNTKKGMELILRTNTRAGMEFYENGIFDFMDCTKFVVHIPSGTYNWKNNIIFSLNCGDPNSEENKNLLKIWRKLKSKVVLKTNAKTVTQNTFRITN